MPGEFPPLSGSPPNPLRRTIGNGWLKSLCYALLLPELVCCDKSFLAFCRTRIPWWTGLEVLAKKLAIAAQALVLSRPTSMIVSTVLLFVRAL